MPVPTETFWNIKRLNLVFFAAAGILVICVAAFIVADAKRDWQGYQREAMVWETAMTVDALAEINSNDEIERQIEDYRRQIEELKATLPTEKIESLEADLAEAKREKAKINLKMAVKKGELGPKQQLIERAILTYGETSEEVAKLRNEYNEIKADYDVFASQMAGYDTKISQIPAKLRALREQVTEVEKQIANIERKEDALEAKRDEVDPAHQGMLVALTEEIRNAPLMDWFNPSLKVKQVVVPDVRTDWIFAEVETVDRCATCHINIDNPAFEPNNLTAFLERQIATAASQNVDQITRMQPVVNLDFWVKAAQFNEDSTRQYHKIVTKTTEALNELRSSADQEPIEEDQLVDELKSLTSMTGAFGGVEFEQWYGIPAYFILDIKAMMQKQMGSEAFDSVLDLYRDGLIDSINAQRKEKGQRQLSKNPVLLGHPQIDMYANVDSVHPIMEMGCTVCHEGSGQETDFTHSAHTPRSIWVDSKTGTPVPDQFVDGHADTVTAIKRKLRETGGSKTAKSHDEHDGHDHSAHGHDHADEAGHSSTGSRYSHADVNINDPDDAAPFAPVYEPHGEAVAYNNPADTSGELRMAVRQGKYWEKTQGWHAVTYMHWEKPMHSLEYIESSCAKCHNEIYDIPEAAPKLVEGRKLFAQLGCVNCHAVSGLEEAGDVKKVGPNLAHAKHKLSAEMTSSWIWAPKALRPMTRMPHYFMLENNSSPADILRTKVEVAAMTHYLQTVKPTEGTPEYKPAPAPETTGDAENGKKLFTTLGCMSCHTNMAEYGEQWITGDLRERAGLSKDDAKHKYEEMSYNQRHWYAMEHLEDKLTLVGPELSGVGTKLTAGRTEEEARTWLIDWLKNPTHYSDYTIMPSFRLDDQQANDMAAYLLTLEHPDYKPADFRELVDTDDGKTMLFKLVASLNRGFNTPDGAEKALAANPDFQTTEQQLEFLGQKMISHYGCNGCHSIPGFENSPSACANLDDWGIKDPHKVDHGYFDHAFYKQHKTPMPGFKVQHEGLDSDSPHMSYNMASGDSKDKIEEVNLEWEHLTGDRRPWLYHKLHNPRVYDRGKTGLYGDLDGEIDPGRPYDKLKMPKFFMNDRQARALVTFVTSLRPALVSEDMLKKTYTPAKRRLAQGRALATMYNCYGCHNIEGNDVDVHKYYGVYNADGTFNENNLNWAPPRLIGQGSKTQPDWLYHFLQNVQPIRPWLEVRMPSFPLNGKEAAGLVDYFSGHTEHMHASLDDDIAVVNALIGRLDQTIADKDAEIANIEARLKDAQEKEETKRAATMQKMLTAARAERETHLERRADWYMNASPSIEALRNFAIRADLATEAELSERLATRDSLRAKWEEVLGKVNILFDAFQTDYPYVPKLMPDLTEADVVRGEMLFAQMGCMAGECHRAGDHELLAEAGLLLNAPPAEEAPAEDGEDYGYGDEAAASDSSESSDEGYGYGDDAGYGEEAGYGDEGGEEEVIYSIAPQKPPAGAPNLAMVSGRLQPRWVKKWLYHARTMQPGTRMQEFWPNGDSFFKVFPPAMRNEKEAVLGYTGEQQREILTNFLYTIGPEKLTYNIDGTRLGPGEKKAAVELTTLAPPPVDESKPVEEEEEVEAPAAPQLSAEEEAAKAAAAVAEKTTSDIELHDATSSYEGTRIVGKVNFEGRAPRRKPVRMSADPVCAKFHRELSNRPMSMDFIVNENGTLRNVFVYVKDGLPAPASIPDEPTIIDQLGCQYHPHVQGVMAGQKVHILNSDPTLHNVKVTAKNNASSNDGMPVKGMVLAKTYTKPELGIELKCDVHAWMGGILHVVDNPYFTTTDVEGNFEIKGLPPGKYTLEAVHENNRIAPVTFEVEVKENTSTRADATLQ